MPSRKRVRPSSLDTTEDSEHSRPFYTNRDGDQWSGTTSGASRGSANRGWSTTPSGTPMFTLYQASLRFGSDHTADKAFSSLMSIKAALNEKHSSSFWTDIHSKLQSRVDLYGLAGILSSSSRTTRGGTHSARRLAEEFQEAQESSDEDQTVLISDSSSDQEAAVQQLYKQKKSKSFEDWQSDEDHQARAFYLDDEAEETDLDTELECDVDCE